MQQDTVERATEPKRRSRSRVAMIEAAKRLLSRSVVNGFTVDDVIREADVARGTFYNHFTSVDALVHETVSAVQNDLYACIGAASANAPDVATQTVFGTATVIRYGYANIANARVLMYVGPGVADPLALGNQLLVGSLRQGVEDGTFKLPCMDSAVSAVLGICEVGLSRMLDLHHEYSAVRKLTYGLCVMVLRCLGVDSRRIDRLAKDAVLQCFDIPLGRSAR